MTFKEKASQYMVEVKPYPAADGGGWNAYCKDFPGLLVNMETIEEAVDEFYKVLEDVLEHQ